MSKRGGYIQSAYGRTTSYGDDVRVTPRRRNNRSQDRLADLPPVKGQQSGWFAGAKPPGTSRAHAETAAETLQRRVRIARMAASAAEPLPLRKNATTAEVDAYKAQLRQDVLGTSDASKKAAAKRVNAAKRRYLG